MAKYKYTRPTRSQLAGRSASEFKTLLRGLGFKVDRAFFGSGCSVAHFRGRAYRFRWWSTEGFMVDMSCPVADFDRWANSVDRVMSFDDWLLHKNNT